MRYKAFDHVQIDLAMRELSKWEIIEATHNCGYLDDSGIKSVTFLNSYQSQYHNTVCYLYATIYWDNSEGQWDKGQVHVWRDAVTGDLKGEF